MVLRVRGSLLFAFGVSLVVGAIAACGGDDDPGGSATPNAADGSTNDVVSTPPDAGSGETSVPVPSGALDPAFGTAGLVLFGAGVPSSENARAILRQPDGKLLVIGAQNETSGSFIVRLTTTGALDTTFGIGGKMLLAGGLAYSAALQPDGKILVGRYTSIARLEANGAIDPTFGVDGRALIDDMTPNVLHVMPDGKILVAGVRPNVSIGFTLARLTSAGVKDATFDGDGYAENTTFSGSRAHSIAIDSQGRIVVSGEIFSDATLPVARFLGTGLRDGAFGTNGEVSIALPQAGGQSQVAIQGDGKIVLAGKSGNNCVTARLDGANGALDATYGAALDGGADAGAAGVVLGPTCGASSTQGLALRSGGKILVATPTGFYQLLSDGSYDTSFGTSGITLLNSGATKLPTNGYQQTMLLLPDESIAGGGSVNGSNGSSPSAWKLTASGVIDTAFATSGQATFPFYATRDEIESVEVLPNDAILFAGEGAKGMVAVRLAPNGAVDTTFGDAGFAEVSIGEPGGLARDATGRIFLGGESKVVALTADGKPDPTFGGPTGTASLRSPYTSDWFWGTHIALDANGRVVVAGYAGGNNPQYMIVARVTAAGVQDATFGTSKGSAALTAYTRTDGSVRGLAVQPDGKAIVSGYADGGGVFVLRLDTSGALDPSFGGGRILFEGISADALVLQPDGKILVGGGGKILRLDTNGALDPTFGQAGAASLAATEIDAAAVRVRADGKIFVAGSKTGADGKTSFGLVRLSASGVVESSTAPAFPVETRAFALAFQSNGATIVGGYGIGAITDRDFALARFAP